MTDVSYSPEAHELLPCPFCGLHGASADYDNNDWWWVSCPHCGARTVTERWATNAIAAWNRRASGGAQTRATERPNCAFPTEPSEAAISAAVRFGAYAIHQFDVREFVRALLGFAYRAEYGLQVSSPQSPAAHPMIFCRAVSDSGTECARLVGHHGDHISWDKPHERWSDKPSVPSVFARGAASERSPETQPPVQGGEHAGASSPAKSEATPVSASAPAAPSPDPKGYMMHDDAALCSTCDSTLGEADAANTRRIPVNGHAAWCPNRFTQPTREWSPPDAKPQTTESVGHSVVSEGGSDPDPKEFPDVKPGTPLPWRYQEESDAYTHIIRAGDCEYVASGVQSSSPHAEANVRYIVAACNAYPRLAERVQQLTAREDGFAKQVARMRGDLETERARYAAMAWKIDAGLKREAQLTTERDNQYAENVDRIKAWGEAENALAAALSREALLSEQLREAREVAEKYRKSVCHLSACHDHDLPWESSPVGDSHQGTESCGNYDGACQLPKGHDGCCGSGRPIPR